MENNNSEKHFENILERLNNILNIPMMKFKNAMIKKEESIKLRESNIEKLTLENEELKRRMSELKRLHKK
ncbi:hypothetical protein CPJCM30710_19740 [Clostridium polyendosporum]|uniref:Uncharacterized protein n=1 Tax=Clostridium polyendosporum TaxID=69208 RepID=A0A919S120_9CLOT|nr:hypothetical protein [Clostridium polyendosporum]GIM29308.1 hypothetical protein CPJCM30710_19740 [Clostridium polyendosporum]